MYSATVGLVKMLYVNRSELSPGLKKNTSRSGTRYVSGRNSPANIALYTRVLMSVKLTLLREMEYSYP